MTEQTGYVTHRELTANLAHPGEPGFETQQEMIHRLNRNKIRMLEEMSPEDCSHALRQGSFWKPEPTWEDLYGPDACPCATCATIRQERNS